MNIQRQIALVVAGFFGFNSAFAQVNFSEPVTLNELFQAADSKNRMLNIYRYEEKIAQHNIENEKKKQLPSLDAALNFSYNGNGLITDRDFSNLQNVHIPGFGNNFSLEAKQLVYAGGAVKTGIENAKINSQIAALNVKEEQQNIRFLLAGNYLELQKLENQKKVILKNIEQTTGLISEVSDKVKGGIALKNNVTRLELQLQSLRLKLVQIENSKKIIARDFINILQLPEGTVVKVKENPDENPENSFDTWKAGATENAASLKSKELEISSALNTEKIIKSERLPQVYLFANNYLNGPVTIEIPAINKNFNYWYAGVGISYDLASLYKNGSRETMARLNVEKQQELQHIEHEKVARNIEIAFIKYEEALEIYKNHLKSVELAEQNYTIINNRYLNSLVLITEMLDADNAKLAARLDAENAKINILYHYYQLRRISGTL
ncbi:MAG: TolC family protein [Flavobacteriia bacterium]|nr:TolC family protein [Flavobacteriia bacterium]